MPDPSTPPALPVVPAPSRPARLAPGAMKVGAGAVWTYLLHSHPGWAITVLVIVIVIVVGGLLWVGRDRELTENVSTLIAVATGREKLADLLAVDADRHSRYRGRHRGQPPPQ